MTYSNKMIIYEDDDVVVTLTPDDKYLKKMIIEIIEKHGRPLYISELKEKIGYLISVDKLKKILIEMIEDGFLVEMPDTALGLPSMRETYVPTRIKKRHRLLVPRRFIRR